MLNSTISCYLFVIVHRKVLTQHAKTFYPLDLVSDNSYYNVSRPSLHSIKSFIHSSLHTPLLFFIDDLADNQLKEKI